MKEEIRSNETMEQWSNRAPLTTPPQNPHTRGGEIFMADGTANSPEVSRHSGKSPSAGRVQNLSGQEVAAVRDFGVADARQNDVVGQPGIVDKQKLRREWQAALTPKELRNPDTRSTIEAALKLGYGPKSVTSKDPSKIEAKQVIANALLTDEQRIKKAEEILQLKLSSEQKKALLKAHYEGMGETGKGNRQAGVYNYTEAQLLRKARILKDKGGFNEAQRRTLIEAGLAAMPVNRSTYNDPLLQAFVDIYNNEVARAGAGNPLSPNFLARQIGNVERMIMEGRVDVAEGTRLVGELQAAFDAENPQRQPGTFFYLQDEEKLILDAGPAAIEKWMNDYFDTIYIASKGKDPLQSPVTSRVSQTYSDAVSYLAIRGRTNEISLLTELFDTRINLMQMASAIGSKNLEQVYGAAGKLTTHGLLHGLTLDSKHVGSMLNRLAERLEDTRLDKREGYGGSRQHVSPEMLQYLQDRVIEEQVGLATAGVGDFADFYSNFGGTDGEKREATKTEVTRSVRSAYDILVSTQRVAVVAARGRNLLGTDAFFSDPGSTFNMFNIEAFTTDKWGIFNTEDEEFLSHIRDGLVEDWIESKSKLKPSVIVTMTDEERTDLGKRLLRDMGAVPDFFSSGWRIKGITDQLSRYFVYKEALVGMSDADKLDPAKVKTSIDELKHPSRKGRLDAAIAKAENFALFLRLKGEVTQENINEKTILWGKVKDSRPEEIIKLLHERLSDTEKTAMNSVVFNPYGINNYDQFKEKYGAVLQALREEGFKADIPRQVDFSILDLHQWDTIERIFRGEAPMIQSVFAAMKNYIDSNNVIERLVNNPRFADIYTRTLNADDALLDRLEDVPENSGMLPLSRIWGGAEVGNDALVRNISDIVAAKKQYDAFVGFVKAEGEEEKLKQAQICGAAAADHSGRFTEATIIRHTIIAYMELTLIPGFLDALGVSKLPFRIPMTEIERIYGPKAKPLSQEERRIMTDKIRQILMGAAKNEIDEMDQKTQEELGKIDVDISLTADQKADRKRDAIAGAEDRKNKVTEKARSMYERTEKVLLVRGGDRAKQKGVVLFFILALFAVTETVGITGITDALKNK